MIIDMKINIEKINIFCLELEYKDCLKKEKELLYQLDSYNAYIEYLEDKILKINMINQTKYIKDNLTDEQIHNIKMIFKDVDKIDL